MEETVRLGRVAGIRVGMNWSVLVIFALVAFSLAAGRFPAQYPDRSTAAYVTAGLIAAVVFFLSLLAHEIAHAIVARRNGIGVDGIVLWLFGGVARLTDEPTDPGADLRIAGVGPLVSLVLSALFAVAAWLAAAVGASDLAVGTVMWLAVINAVLAVFNLVPAAPLDGGRLLRAFLWRRRGDRTSAAVSAARAGTVFGFVLIGLGLLEFAFGTGLGGLWFVLIGWFLVNAAKAEGQQAIILEHLRGMQVRDAMTSDPVTIPEDTSVADAIDDYVFRHRHSTFPVVGEGGRPAGLVTLGRLKQVAPEDRSHRRIREVAAPLDEVTSVEADAPLVDVLRTMSQGAEGRVLVVDGDGQLVGIVSPTDVTRLLGLADLRPPRPLERT